MDKCLIFFSANLLRELKDIAIQNHSEDNITIIVVFLKHPSSIKKPFEIMEFPNIQDSNLVDTEVINFNISQEKNETAALNEVS